MSIAAARSKQVSGKLALRNPQKYGIPSLPVFHHIRLLSLYIFTTRTTQYHHTVLTLSTCMIGKKTIPVLQIK